MFKLFFLFILFLVLGCHQVSAAFLIDLSSNYHSDEDDVTSFSYSRFDYRGFLAAGLDSKEKFFFGQNISQFGREFKNDSVSGKYSVLELGPRFQYYFTEDKTFYTSVAWNPYVKGSRTVGTTESDISGSSYFINFGWQLKIARALSLGASINYHSISISKETDTTTNVETEKTESYTTIYPMIEISLRFR
jgi:hypothetical protein